MSAAKGPDRLAALSALGLGRDATPHDIVSAYRRLALSVHPDTSGGEIDHSEFARITDAYQYLTRSSEQLPPPAFDPPVRGHRSSPMTGSPSAETSPAIGSWDDTPQVVAGPVKIRPLPPESR